MNPCPLLCSQISLQTSLTTDALLKMSKSVIFQHFNQALILLQIKCLDTPGAGVAGSAEWTEAKRRKLYNEVPVVVSYDIDLITIHHKNNRIILFFFKHTTVLKFHSSAKRFKVIDRVQLI